MTCSYDTGNKPFSESKSLVLLTQSHSSTLAQEIINLLRSLHGIVGWNQVLNTILMQKLNLAAYFSSDHCLMSMVNEGSSPDEQHYMVIACLNVMGAWDVRPRIGAVAEVEGSTGTVVRVTQKGKLCVQLHDRGEVKKVQLNGLKLVGNEAFSLERMPLSESLIRIWATLLLNKQGSGLSNHEKRPTHGE